MVTARPDCLQGTFTLQPRPIGSRECNMGDRQGRGIPRWVVVLGNVARAVDRICVHLNPVCDC